jgi:quercetin dioxygenase-like cupin family protein
MEGTFQTLALQPGRLVESAGAFDTSVSAWRHSVLQLSGGTHFLFGFDGETCMTFRGRDLTLPQGWFACVPGDVELAGGVGVAITRGGWQGLFQLGGPLEARGRLAYIDGCTDTLLVAPPRLGDACLNHLHIPAGTAQTRHTHPSLRAGIVVRGRGRCVTPDGEHPLEPGLAFLIPAGCPHSFFTDDEALDVIAYHPDSDFGPTDDIHPMVNRTVL